MLQTESQYHKTSLKGQIKKDVSKIAPNQSEIFSPIKETFKRADGEMVTRTKNATAEVRRLYQVRDFLLGEGAFGKVFLAHSKSDKNAKFAIKILPVANLSESTKQQMETEIEVLNKLDHPYVAKYQHSF